MTAIDVSVVIYNYDSLEWLKKTLYGYNNQTYRMFEVILVEREAKEDTVLQIEEIQKEMFFSIHYVQCATSLNQELLLSKKVIGQCSTPYVIIVSGNCVPRKDFVEQHVKFREEGSFISGQDFRLSREISLRIRKQDIYTEKCFSVKWLKNNGLKSSIKNAKLSSSIFKAFLVHILIQNKSNQNCFNTSAWKEDVIRANEIEENTQSINQYQKLKKRMFDLGIKSKNIGNNTICLYLGF